MPERPRGARPPEEARAGKKSRLSGSVLLAAEASDIARGVLQRHRPLNKLVRLNPVADLPVVEALDVDPALVPRFHVRDELVHTAHLDDDPVADGLSAAQNRCACAPPEQPFGDAAPGNLAALAAEDLS